MIRRIRVSRLFRGAINFLCEMKSNWSTNSSRWIMIMHGVNAGNYFPTRMNNPAVNAFPFERKSLSIVVVSFFSKTVYFIFFVTSEGLLWGSAVVGNDCNGFYYPITHAIPWVYLCFRVARIFLSRASGIVGDTSLLPKTYFAKFVFVMVLWWNK